jgi:hypothetical protein
MQLENKVKAVKEEKSYGNLQLSSATHPFVKDLKLGEATEITITVKVTSLRQPDRWEISDKQAKPTDVHASVNVTNIKPHKPAKKGDTDDD